MLIPTGTRTEDCEAVKENRKMAETRREKSRNLNGVLDFLGVLG